jgi:hypothetical protein
MNVTDFATTRRQRGQAFWRSLFVRQMTPQMSVPQREALDFGQVKRQAGR